MDLQPFPESKRDQNSQREEPGSQCQTVNDHHSEEHPVEEQVPEGAGKKLQDPGCGVKPRENEEGYHAPTKLTTCARRAQEEPYREELAQYSISPKRRTSQIDRTYADGKDANGPINWQIKCRERGCSVEHFI